MNEEVQFAILSAMAHTEGKQLPALFVQVGDKVIAAGSTDMISDYIYPMKDLGWLINVGTTWSMTLDGYAAFNLLRMDNTIKHNTPSRATGPVSPPKEHYTGIELQQQVGRAGAYDAFKCPSRIGNDFIPYLMG